MNVIELLLIALFGTSSRILVLGELLSIAGQWKIFEKCGADRRLALIPLYREYVLSECAGREPEGRVVFVTVVINRCLVLLLNFLDPLTLPGIITSVILVSVTLVYMIYIVRVYNGLTEVFQRRKIWIPIWLMFDWLAALLWGFRKKYQPQWKIQDFEEEESRYFSGAHSNALDEGLAVNINERSVRDFFKKKYLLRDIHMYIKPGSMVLLLGGSGAGKSTFVNAVNGYEKAKAEIVLNGDNVYKEYKRMKYKVGFVPQQDLLRMNDTVHDTLDDSALLRMPKDATAAERKETIENVMETLGMTGRTSGLVAKKSGGQKKRISIGMELISDPDLFILDEPDSGLDGVIARELFEKLRQIADQGKIIIAITHTPDRVADLFDKVIVLARDSGRCGRLAFYGSPDEAREFFGRDTMERIVMCVNREEEGGEGRADEFIRRYAAMVSGKKKDETPEEPEKDVRKPAEKKKTASKNEPSGKKNKKNKKNKKIKKNSKGGRRS